MREHVVVFGVDGVRYDTLREARTPTLDAIAGDGFIGSFRVNDAAPTISGPGWATIATGVLADRHLIYDNDLTGHRIADYPDFLTRVRASLPGSRTYAIGSWPQLVHETYGGPIFLGGGIMPLGEHPGTEGWEKADEVVATDACIARVSLPPTAMPSRAPTSGSGGCLPQSSPGRGSPPNGGRSSW